jgi:serine/threonine-protein kinase
MLKGKFAYMSPEQARGEKVDARTDIFALGIVLWELLTGGRLFEGESDLAVLRAVTESLIAPPARLNPDVPAELSDIVMKALARPVGERFQTAFDFDRALANYALRNAKSVEDTSVSNFLALMFKEELSPVKSSSRELATPAETLPPDDDFGLGNTYAKAPGQTLTATPTPMGPIPGAPGPLRPSKTEPAVAAANPARAKTEQMPALAKRPSSRRFDPIQVEDSSSVTLRPSLRLGAQRQTSASAAGLRGRCSRATARARPRSRTCPRPRLCPMHRTRPRRASARLHLASLLTTRAATTCTRARSRRSPTATKNCPRSRSRSSRTPLP